MLQSAKNGEKTKETSMGFGVQLNLKKQKQRKKREEKEGNRETHRERNILVEGG